MTNAEVGARYIGINNLGGASIGDPKNKRLVATFVVDNQRPVTEQYPRARTREFCKRQSRNYCDIQNSDDDVEHYDKMGCGYFLPKTGVDKRIRAGV